MISYTHYTDNLPEGVGGCATGPLIRIRPRLKDDAGIHAHEQLHVQQFYFWLALGIIAAYFLYPLGGNWWALAISLGLSVNGLLYLFIPRYRLWAEIEAYKVQAQYYADDRLPLFAQFIAHSYRLNITTEDAYKLLKD